MYYLHKTLSAVSCVKPNASQWEATLRDVGFATVYRRIYPRKFLTLSNQTSCHIRECIRIFFNNLVWYYLWFVSLGDDLHERSWTNVFTLKTAVRVANNVDPNQKMHSLASNLALFYLLRHVSPSTCLDR